MKKEDLKPKLQKYKGLVVLRGDIVKDDSGAYPVFSGQGWSAFQMSAAKVIDVVARLPDCGGQAADTVSAHTSVKLEDAPTLLKFLIQNVQPYGYVFHDTAAKIMDVIANLPDYENGSSRCSISLHHRLKWKMLPDCSKIQSQNVQTYGYALQDTNGPKSSSYGRPSCSS